MHSCLMLSRFHVSCCRTDAQSPAGRVTVGVKSSPSVKELTESCAGANLSPASHCCCDLTVEINHWLRRHST